MQNLEGAHAIAVIEAAFLPPGTSVITLHDRAGAVETATLPLTKSPAMQKFVRGHATDPHVSSLNAPSENALHALAPPAGRVEAKIRLSDPVATHSALDGP